MSKLGELIAKIFGGKSPLDVVKDLVEEFHLSPEEKQKFAAAAAERLSALEKERQDFALMVLQSEVADTADARSANVKIQGDRPGWMARNVAYIIDVFIVGLWGGVTVYLLGGMLHLIAQKQGVDYTGVTAIWGGVTALATQIIGFHRGSSQGSADKQKFIDRIIAR